MNYSTQELADAWARGDRLFVASALESAETPAIALATLADVFVLVDADPALVTYFVNH